PKLPFSQYTVTAVQIGYLNQTKTATIAATTGATATFTLSKGTGTSTVPAVTDLSAVSFTSPAASRAITQTSASAAINAIRAYIQKQHGLWGHRPATPTRATLRSASPTTRSTPAGSIIENDLFWPYDNALNNVLGYDILRSVGTDTQFVSIALALDPL